jgi:hypothetical protein
VVVDLLNLLLAAGILAGFMGVIGGIAGVLHGETPRQLAGAVRWSVVVGVPVLLMWMIFVGEAIVQGSLLVDLLASQWRSTPAS